MMKSLIIATALAVIATLPGRAMAQYQSFPDELLSASTYDGRPVTIEDLRGRVVVLSFWSTTCAICREEMPELNAVVNSLSKKNTLFLGVTLDSSARLQRYLNFNRVMFTVVPNGFGILLKYADRDSEGRVSMPYPTYIVLGETGAIEAKFSGYGKLKNVEGAVEKLLR